MNYDLLLQTILDVGEEMVVAGAEVSRVEDSVERMCEAYDMTRVNVFIIVSNLQVTVETPEGRILTQIRRIVRNDVNFDRIDYLNDLSRTICADKPDVEEMKRLLEEVMNRPQQSRLLGIIGSICTASGFTIFFNGSVMDGVAAAVMAVVIVFFNKLIGAREKNMIALSFIVSMIAGLCAIALVRMHIGENVNVIMMGGIMLLIPGIAMTNAVRDMLTGDTASGLLRLANSLLIAASIACGFAIAIVLAGGVL